MPALLRRGGARGACRPLRGARRLLLLRARHRGLRVGAQGLSAGMWPQWPSFRFRRAWWS
eukprot:11260405-Alexandrium_andersonii.AAC.1